MAASQAIDRWLNEALPRRPFSIVSGGERPNPDDQAFRASYRRICLISPGDGTWPATVLEMDEHMLSICHRKMAPRSNISGHRFGELLEAAIAGNLDSH